jgi:hypothetical protein
VVNNISSEDEIMIDEGASLIVENYLNIEENKLQEFMKEKYNSIPANN